jgi:DNA-binding CsgD family transcriptional regulator
VYLQDFGFSDYSFIQMERREEPETHMYTTPKEFSDIYLSEGIYEHDQLLSYAAVNTEPIFQSTIDAYLRSAPVKTQTILKNERIQRYVKGKGFLDYYNVPLPAATGQGNVLLSLTAQHVQSDELIRRAVDNQQLLHILCKAVDYVGTVKFPHYFLDSGSSDVKIFPKPLRLLILLAKEDLTLNDAAARLGITRSTANAHVAAIKNAFGTRTLWGSVFKAMQLGLINKKN